jgi:hypothetical protein
MKHYDEMKALSLAILVLAATGSVLAQEAPGDERSQAAQFAREQEIDDTGEKGFAAVAVEADWPDAYRINRFVRAAGADEDAVQSLADFGRFPTWMWRNADVPGSRRLVEPPRSPHGDTLQELLRFLDRTQPNARVVVWAHNSHLGDARATEMSQRGELNVGQLVREAYGAKPCSWASRHTPAR